MTLIRALISPRQLILPGTHFQWINALSLKGGAIVVEGLIGITLLGLCLGVR